MTSHTLGEEVRRRWAGLNKPQRAVLVVVAATDATLRVAALVDVARRPRATIRGPRWLWALSLAVVNSAGLLPLVYFIRGRRAADR